MLPRNCVPVKRVAVSAYRIPTDAPDEHLLFDGVLTPVDGALRPDLARPGLGLDFKHSDAAKYAL